MFKQLILIVSLFSVITLNAQDFYDPSKVTDIKVEFDFKNWDTMLDSLKELGEDDRIIGKVIIDGTLYDSVGIRYKGNSSYFNVRNSEHSKLPFNIKADYIKDDQRFFSKYKSLKLSNVFRDPSFLREVLSYEIVGKYMPAPKANYACLTINDQYLGFYNNSESVDKDFLEAHYGYKKGVLFKCDPDWHAEELRDCPKGDKASLMYLGDDPACYYGLYELKTKKGWEDLIELTKILNTDIDQIETILNVDQVLWMHAFNSVLVNLDSYSGRLCHNYYLYRDSFGIFHPVVWDMNLSFGGFRYDGLGSPLSTEEMQTSSLFNHYKQSNEERPLITNLLKNNLYRKIYVAHAKTILEENFINGEYLKRAKEIQQSIDTFVKADTNKLYTYEAFKENLTTSTSVGKSSMIGIAELMEARTDYLKNHPIITKEGPKISEVQYIGETEKNLITARVENVETVYLAYRLKKHAPFKRIEMRDDGMEGDKVLSDDIYSAHIEKVPGTEYYIIAEGEKTASLSPARASFEYYTIEENVN